MSPYISIQIRGSVYHRPTIIWWLNSDNVRSSWIWIERRELRKLTSHRTRTRCIRVMLSAIRGYTDISSSCLMSETQANKVPESVCKSIHPFILSVTTFLPEHHCWRNISSSCSNTFSIKSPVPERAWALAQSNRNDSTQSQKDASSKAVSWKLEYLNLLQITLSKFVSRK